MSKPQIRLKSRIRRTLSTGMRSQFAHVWSTGALAHRPDASGTKIGRGVAVSLCVASVVSRQRDGVFCSVMRGCLHTLRR